MRPSNTYIEVLEQVYFGLAYSVLVSIVKSKDTRWTHHDLSNLILGYVAQLYFFDRDCFSRGPVESTCN